jgi:serine/threonine protein kinase
MHTFFFYEIALKLCNKQCIFMPQSQEIFKERYQLQSQLGLNSGRQTWLAKDLETNGEFVVVKLLTFGGDVQWEDLKLFEREAQVLKQLNHPRIPKYRDYFTIDDRSLWFGLVQEHIQGASLKELLVQGQKFTELQVENIVIDTLEILIYLHGLNPPVLHRDIKPSNLIWSDRQEIYLVDFGAVQDKASAEGKTFTVVGTYGYAPMEQYGGRSVPASDLYGLGATAIHLLTGISPAELPQDDDLNIQFRDRSGASPQLIDWVQKMTAPSVKRRFASAKEALEALYQDPEQITKPKANSRQIKIPQPFNSRVEIWRFPTKLVVTIPSSLFGGKIVSVLLASLALFGMLPLAFFMANANFVTAIMIFMIVIYLAYFQVIKSFTTIFFSVDLSERTCRLSKRTFGWQHYVQKFGIYQLEYIYTSMSNKTKGSVAIQVQNNRFMLGDDKLTELETAWLVQEIQDWLQNHQSIDP